MPVGTGAFNGRLLHISWNTYDIHVYYIYDIHVYYTHDEAAIRFVFVD